MPANEEVRLVAKIIDAGDMRPVLDAGVRLDDFVTPDGSPGFEYLLKYWRGKKTGGEVPTRELYEKRFPSHNLPPEDRLSLDATIEQFKSYAVRERLSKLSMFIIDYATKPDKVIAHLHKEIREISTVRRVTRDVVLADSMNSAVNDYMLRKDQEGYIGVPFPWDVLNEETGGMLNSQFIVFYGRPKSMKTWVLLACACHAYHFHNRRVLIYTREMGEDQMRDRCICLLIGAPYSAYRRGVLHEIPSPWGGTMEDRFLELAEVMKDEERICKEESGFNKGLIITSDRDDPKGGGVNGIRQKVEDWTPDLICVDGIYLLRNDRSGKRSVNWEDQYAVSQDLKDIAQDFDKPLIGTTQGTRDGKESFSEGTEDIAFADSVGMDCDLAVKIMKKRTSDPERNELALLVKAAREINMYGFAINGNAATNFGELMHVVRSDEGIIQEDPDTGEQLVEPVVFHGPGDAKEMFKSQGSSNKRKNSESEGRTPLTNKQFVKKVTEGHRGA